MQCPKCHFDNPDTSRFCADCGTQIIPSDEISAPTETLETPKEELSTGSTFAGRYQIIEELGKGGMGKVYRVKDEKLNEEMALKILKPEIAADKGIIERFKNELKLARKIAHRNVCKMYDLNEKGETPYITMEYVRGEDLKSFIRRKEKLSKQEAITIAKQVCKGLAEAHELRVIHRDLKPQNIMIDEKSNAKIMDFGIARSVEAPGITQTGMIIGTPDYISPEQAEGEEADQRSDIYALGVILYEMVTGSVPFKGDTPLSVAIKHKTNIPLDPRKINPEVSEDFSRLILICMEKDRERRYQAAVELLSDLRNIEEGFPLGTKIRPRRETFVATLIRKKFFIPALVIALAIIAVVIWQVLPQKEAVPSTSSSKPSLAVVYFKNNTGDESLDHWRIALADLLITDLSQSKYIRVLSGERLTKILTQLGRSKVKTFSSDVLREVSERGGVENILVGNFNRAEGIYRINLTLQDGRTGELIGSESVEGVGERDFFPMVDELTRRIKVNFQLSEEQIADDIDEKVEKITTSSPEAYKYFVEANKRHRSGDYEAAISLSKKALELDPEFAMAYRGMSISYFNLGQVHEQKKAIQKAIELSYRVSERERYLIQGTFYIWSETTYDKAIDVYKELLDVYPEDYVAKANLGWLYLNIEEWDKVIEVFQEVIQGHFGSVIAYWNQAEALMAKGLYDKARLVLENGRELFPNNGYTYNLLAFSYICQSQYDSALSEIDEAVSRGLDMDHIKLKGDIFFLQGDLKNSEREHLKLSGKSLLSRLKLAGTLLYQGKIEEAKKQLRDTPELGGFLADINLRYGYPEDALREYNKRLNESKVTESLTGQIRALHDTGLAYLQMEAMDKARSTAADLKKIIQNSVFKKTLRFSYHLTGRIELEQGNISKAIELFRQAESLCPNQRYLYYKDHVPFLITPILDALASAYFRNQDFEKARKTYEKIISLTAARLYYGDIYAKSFYGLGKINEQLGNTAKAIEHYQKFLSLWKDADLGIPEVGDAKKRLAELKSP